MTYLGLLEGIAVAANRSDTPHEVLPLALKLICTATAWPVGHAWILHGSAVGELCSAGVWHAESPASPETFADFQRASESLHLRDGEGLPGRVLADGQPHWIANIEDDANYPRQHHASAAGLAACFAFPVCSGSRTVGVLEFYAHESRGPDPGLLDIMAKVGVQLGRVFERSAAMVTLAATEQRTRDILDCAADAFIGMDQDDRITEWNQAAAALFGWTRDEAIGRTVTDTIVPLRYREDHCAGVKHVLATGIPRVHGKPLELAALNREGCEFPIEMTLWSLKSGSDWKFYAFARDITARKHAEQELRHRAYHDTLTGLPNRALVMERLGQLLARRGTDGTRPAALFVDIDHFKRINDSIGHEAGDRVLVAVAEQLRRVIRPEDTVARLAGDEFLIVCPDVGSARDATFIAERVLAVLTDPVDVQNDSVFLTASIGVALGEDDDDAEALVASADMAMYRAKHSGRACYELFDRQIRQAATSRLRVEQALRAAIEHDELRLYFQPIVDAKDGTLAAVEALMRWQHPTMGLLQPAEFIPIAEETGLIVPMGTWAIKEACRYAREWCDSGVLDAPLCMSVNLSARQLAQSDLVATVERMLAAAALDPARVEFGIEVTETVAMRNVATSTKTLQALRALGVHLSIDDFGTGYSSLAYLKHLPADTLKVDMSFVRQLTSSPVDRAVVRTIASLGRSLGLAVVAEGVETSEQAQALRDAGVDLLQGFLYARPQPPDAFFGALARHRTMSRDACDTAALHRGPAVTPTSPVAAPR